MKYSEEKMNEYRSTMAVPERPEYPYGLCISLEEDQIKALEIVGTPQVGQVMMVMALVTVKSVSTHESEESGEKRSVSLQITDMSVKPYKVKSTEDALYGED
jgi:hypothetical protein